LHGTLGTARVKLLCRASAGHEGHGLREIGTANSSNFKNIFELTCSYSPTSHPPPREITPQKKLNFAVPAVLFPRGHAGQGLQTHGRFRGAELAERAVPLLSTGCNG
jgi:hypothetical protein